MPQRELMNGMTSHAFAAIMAATVVMFPTPQDLWHTIPPRADGLRSKHRWSRSQSGFPGKPIPGNDNSRSGGCTQILRRRFFRDALDLHYRVSSGDVPVHFEAPKRHGRSNSPPRQRKPQLGPSSVLPPAVGKRPDLPSPFDFSMIRPR